MRKRIAVVGGGIAGLAAAVRLRDVTRADTEIIVYEQSGALGGKLRTGELAGLRVERGAESFLNGSPDGGPSAAVRFAHRVGLGDALVHPAAQPAALAIGGALARIPAGTLVGVPGDLSALDGVALPEADADADTGHPLLAAGQDIAVGELVRSRYGAEVVDRLVDPMLGGVYAGRADRLSLRATMPQLARTAETEHTLRGAVRAAQALSRRTPGQPVFAAVDGGMSRLIGAAATTARARISLGLPVRGITRTGNRWHLTLGPAPQPQTDEVDAVILAVPAAPAARLLADLAPGAAAALGDLEYASVALAGMALPPGTRLPELSGFLVPPGEGTLVKAATFFTRKWPHLTGPDGPVIVRASLGRAGEQERLQLSDPALLAIAHRELSELAGTRLPSPTASWIQRWGGGLPQYAPGHPDRVAAARAALPAGIALAGAALDGVGIPVCVASGEQAADDVNSYLEASA
ncbi:protoporphyrinogen oxidase [Actinoplanes sp. SE50]|uniref:protoporphyrinogen oxidase n=1 Tax=unclassified Actinoplanes TaxID=2626549 RepID=UPI00023EC19A|nr:MULTISPECIES: protoporphyrinogen oxidase [unclassified Actinoplanes]AEV87965.1 protoporphyrinogen oxidase [Actinoplanes sp. SE50/110]ATO86369.1 protoporphyrinogen oxidase [Actinoplanes sp. SE50]SLM03784.1 protoporphyrinogen oxidase [Actinoplanes sp. SE50/110]